MSSILSGLLAMLQQQSGSSSQVAVPQKELKLLVSFTTTHEVDTSSFFESIANCLANVRSSLVQ